MDAERLPIMGVVEDSDVDFALFARACRDDFALRRWSTGEAAIEEFRRDSRQLAEMAVLVVDLGLTGMGGHEVVTRVREFPEGKTLPVCLFTGSRLEADRRRAVFTGADSYLVKPNNVEQLRRMPELLKQLAAKRPDRDVPAPRAFAEPGARGRTA